jgi:hypothetical protein
MGDELVKETLSFASRVFVERPMDHVPPIWDDAGLIKFENGTHQLLCPAATDALLSIFDQDVIRDAVSMLSSDPNTRWRALELGVVYVFRQAMAYGDPVVLECTMLDGNRSLNLYLKVKNIVHSESRPPVSSLPPGTMFIYPVRNPFIDFFIHDIDGQKVALTVSDSSYMDHQSRYPDIETMKEDFKNFVMDGNSSEIQFVYLTTTREKMRQTGKLYMEQVLLIFQHQQRS